MGFKYVVASAFLCLVLMAMPTVAAECAIDCPGDLNGDCKVDFKDISIITKFWLRDCTLPATLPLLKVRQAGITEEQVARLTEQFDLNPELLGFEDGALAFVDPVNLQSVPTMPLDDPEIRDALLKESEREPGAELQFEVLNLAGLRKISPIPQEVALDEILVALSRADVQLGEAVPQTSHTTFELVDTSGNMLLPAVQLDTSVNMQMFSGEIPIIGPGALFSATIAPSGQMTHLLVAYRGFEPADPVELLMPDAAVAKASAALGGRFLPEGDMKLVYYAPPLSERNVQTLVPHYDVGGILYGAEGQQANKLRKLIPAISDLRLVPQIYLSAVARGDFVNADVGVEGGEPPYRFEWFSSSVDLSRIPDDQSQIEYNAAPRQEQGQEILTVKVTDDNGIIVEASETLFIAFFAQQPPEATLLVGGVRDFGVERAVSDLCAANQTGFVNRFLADGVTKRFNWTGLSAWEQDFKQPPAGTDTTYVDNADIVFYCGHGYGGGFTFESNTDDGYLTYLDAAGAWGNNDLEWLSLLSCQVLEDTYDGKKWWTRWGPAFDGLHLLTGFQTNAYDWSGFGPRYADYMLGRNFGFINIKVPVRAAWFLAKKEQQPSSVQAVVMGVVGPGGVISGYNDYFWGKGPVGPDLRGANITAYWRVVYQ